MFWHRLLDERCCGHVYTHHGVCVCMHTYVCKYMYCHCKDKGESCLKILWTSETRRKSCPFIHCCCLSSFLLWWQGFKGEGMLLETLDYGSCHPAPISLIPVFYLSQKGGYYFSTTYLHVSLSSAAFDSFSEAETAQPKYPPLLSRPCPKQKFPCGRLCL